MPVNSYGSSAMVNGPQQYVSNDMPFQQGQNPQNQGHFPIPPSQLQQQQQKMYPPQQQQQSTSSNSYPQQNAFSPSGPPPPQQQQQGYSSAQQQQMMSQQQQQQISSQQQPQQQNQFIGPRSSGPIRSSNPNVPPNSGSQQPFPLHQYASQQQQQSYIKQQQQQQAQARGQVQPQQQGSSRAISTPQLQQSQQQQLHSQAYPQQPAFPPQQTAYFPHQPAYPQPQQTQARQQQQSQSQPEAQPQFEPQPQPQPQARSQSQSQFQNQRGVMGAHINNNTFNVNSNSNSNTNTNLANTPNNSNSTLQKSKDSLNSYIFDFMQKSNFKGSAKTFAQEANIVNPAQPAQFQFSDTSKGFLTEWWQIFWDLFNTTTRRGGSEIVNKYYQIVANQRRKDNSHKGQMLYAAKLQNLAEQRGEYGNPSMDPFSILSLIHGPNFDFSKTTSNSTINSNSSSNPVRSNDMRLYNNNNDNNNDAPNSGSNNSNNSNPAVNPTVNNKKVGNPSNFNPNGMNPPASSSQEQQSKLAQLQQVQQQQLQQRQIQVQLQLQRQLQQQRQQQRRAPSQQSVVSFPNQNLTSINSPLYQQGSPYDATVNIPPWRPQQGYNNPAHMLGNFQNSMATYDGSKSVMTSPMTTNPGDMNYNRNNFFQGNRPNSKKFERTSMPPTPVESRFRIEDNNDISNAGTPMNGNNNNNNILSSTNNAKLPKNMKLKRQKSKAKKTPTNEPKKKPTSKPSTPSVSTPGSTAKTPRSRKNKAGSRAVSPIGSMSPNNMLNESSANNSNPNSAIIPLSATNNNLTKSAVPSYVADELGFMSPQDQISPRTVMPENINNSKAHTPNSNYNNNNNIHKSHKKDSKNTQSNNERENMESSFAQMKNTPLATVMEDESSDSSQNKGNELDKKLDNSKAGYGKTTSSDSSFGVIDIRKSKTTLEDANDEMKAKSAHSRKRKESTKTEKTGEHPHKKERKTKKPKVIKSETSEKKSSNPSSNDSKKSSSDEKEEDKIIAPTDTLMNIEGPMVENNDRRIHALTNPLESDLLQAHFGDEDEFAGFNFSNVDGTPNEQPSLNSVIPTGDTVASYPSIDNDLDTAENRNDVTTASNILEDNDMDFNFMDWQ